MDVYALRAAVPGDAEEIRAIYAPYVETTAVTFDKDVPSAAFFREKIEKTLVRYPWLVAEKDGRLAGYAYLGPHKGRAAYDWSAEVSVYVRMEDRGGGIGRRLYQKLEQIAALQGILNLNACIAYPVQADEYLDDASPRFHEKMGYRRNGHFHRCANKFGRWYDMIWMEKLLAEHLPDPAPPLPFSSIRGQVRYD